MANNLFDVGPLFESESTQEPEIQDLFGINPTLDPGGAEESVEAKTLKEKLSEVTMKTAEEVEAAKNKGIFARYPIVESKEDEKREFARLKRRGLTDKEANRRIEKFRRKGGRVKTSSKVLAAATIMGGAIKGYLATKQGRAIPAGTGLSQLQAQAQQRTQEAIRKIEEIGDEEKAIILAEDDREFKAYLEEVKADAGLRKQIGKEARDAGIPTVDAEGNDYPIDMITEAVVAAKAKRAKAAETLSLRKQAKSEATEGRIQSKQAVDTAIQLRDHTILTDEDIAEHFNIPSGNQDAIDTKRKQMAGRLRIMSLQDQGRLVSQGIRREIDVERLEDIQTAPPKETPKEKLTRELEEQEIKDRHEAALEYEQSLPSVLAGVDMFADEPAVLQSMILQRAQLLQRSDPDAYPNLSDAVTQLQKDLQEMQVQMGGTGSFVGSLLKKE